MDPGTEAAGSPARAGCLRVPGWEQHPWLRAGFSVRRGGRSSAYGLEEQNLGWTAEDDLGVVAGNRAAFAEAVAGESGLPLVTVRQVHSAVVRDLEAEREPWRTTEGKACLEGDGLISLHIGRLLAVLTADCVPVLVADTRTHAVGAFHAGWRGTLGRIVQQGVAQMAAQYDSRPEDLIAAIGPCIQGCCFEIGPEVRASFEGEFADGESLFRCAGRHSLHMDLSEANRRQLTEAGLSPEQIAVLPWCTACARDDEGRRRFFSYRAENGVTGRMLSAIAAMA